MTTSPKESTHALMKEPVAYVPQIRLYQNWLKQERGISFEQYEDLWQWSISDLETFWQSIWDYFELQSPTPHKAVLAKNAMPGAVWFPGAQVNYASQILRPMLQVFRRSLLKMSWAYAKKFHGQN